MQSLHTIKVKDQLVKTDRIYIMGVLNVTPDSFYAGSRVQGREALQQRIRQLETEGADWIDVGGYSSRPGAEDISIAEEKRRLQPALEILSATSPGRPVSVDTFRSEVARWAIENYGVAIINDISGGHLDPEMHSVAAHYGVPYIGMHMRGTPQTMQQNTQYDDIMREMMLYFAQLQEKAWLAGINDLIIDPGFGFGKSLEDNYLILKRLNEFSVLNVPILTGISRKSMIYKYLKITPQDSLYGTIALHTLAIQKGASVIRVHDVKPARDMVEVVQKTLNKQQ